MKTPQDFYNQYHDKAIDYDGVYGVQCVDGFKVFCKWVGVPVINTGNGYASGYWLNRFKNGFSKYFDFITDKSQVKKGDWCIWNNGSSCSSSHIAMYWGAYGSGKAYFFGQRQGTNDCRFIVTRLNTDFMGALRWKPWNTNPYSKPSIILNKNNAAYGKRYGGGQGTKWVQWQLNHLGLYGGALDGYFGPKTQEAVKQFQRTHKDQYGRQLEADGSVGPLTREALARA